MQGCCFRAYLSEVVCEEICERGIRVRGFCAQALNDELDRRHGFGESLMQHRLMMREPISALVDVFQSVGDGRAAESALSGKVRLSVVQHNVCS